LAIEFFQGVSLVNCGAVIDQQPNFINMNAL
jgi:hypothetical protein